MIGRVIRYFEEKRYGFVRGEDNQTYFIRESKLNGEHIQTGYLVFFRPYHNDRGDYNVKNVIVIDSYEERGKYGKKSK